MKQITLLCFAISSLLIIGCGDSTIGGEADKAMNAQQGVLGFNEVRKYQIMGADIAVSFNAEDELYHRCYSKSYTYPVDELSTIGRASDFAFAKRKAALNMSREVFSYSFKNYIFLDGVSGFTYNLSYIMQTPHKVLRGLRCMDGVFRYIKSLFELILGVICAIIGLVLSPIVNTACHPFETFSNLTVGIIHLCVDTDPPVSWFTYVFRTNILASLWDIIWGSVIYPLWQAVVFFI